MKRTLTIILFTLVAFSFIVSCSDSDDTSESPIAGNWRVTSIKVSNATLEQLAPNNEDIIITFEDNGDYVGSTSVNQFSGTYEIESTTLTLLSFTTTEVADTQLGNAFYASVTGAIVPDTTFAQFGFAFDSGELVLTFGDGGRLVLE